MTPQLLRIVAGAFLSTGSVIAAGNVIAPRTPLPRAVRFTTGAVLYSLLVFALLAMGAGYTATYAGLAAGLSFTAWRTRAITTHLPPMSWPYRLLFAAYGLMYLIVALAPEIQEDAAGYHLRIVADYVRTHALSDRITFYDVLPHGLEMLFLPAFAIGAHSAAKLVHFAFLIATVPLIRSIANDDRIGIPAAAIFFMMPVAGVDGTAAYTDMALVTAAASTLYLLIRWKKERLIALLLCAALNAGFCYTIKQNFAIVPIAAIIFVALSETDRLGRLLFALISLTPALPWIVNSWLLTGNPAAPFLNQYFPNPSSTPDIERQLLAISNAFRADFSVLKALPNYALLGGNQGLIGPAFLLLPLSLLALRKRQGRILLTAALILAIPILSNTGTRFLMPALAPASIALASVLPAPALIALVSIQAVASTPAVLNLYDKRPEWRIKDIPVKAALRMTPEDVYLAQTLPRYTLTQLLAQHTPASATIFTGASLPESYTDRNLLFYWQSAQGARFTDILHFGQISHGTEGRLISIHPHNSARLKALSEFTVVSTGAGNVWKFLPPGSSLSIPAGDVVIWPAGIGQESIETVPTSITRTNQTIDVRRDVTASIRTAGCRYILLQLHDSPFADIARDMSAHLAEWNLTQIASESDFILLRISQPR